MLDREEDLCRICGLRQEDPPWGDEGITPSFDICDCCGCEFGYQDIQLQSIFSNRDRWIQAGSTWYRPKHKPSNWNLDEQLKQIPSRYR